MPHVQIKGALNLSELCDPLGSIIESNPPLVLKVSEAYLGQTGERILLEAVVVEGHLRQAFFVLIRSEDDHTIIRCHPTMHVQKTDGVKRMIALIAKKILALAPGSEVGNTNLEPYLSD